MASEAGPGNLDGSCSIRTSPDTVPGNFCASLRQFVEEKEVRIKAILDNLGWTREYIEQHVGFSVPLSMFKVVHTIYPTAW